MPCVLLLATKTGSSIMLMTIEGFLAPPLAIEDNPFIKGKSRDLGHRYFHSKIVNLACISH